MTDAGSHFALDRSPWNQRWVWCALAILALVLHYAIGPVVVFPVLFLPPIMLAAWQGGPRISVGLTVGMSVIRFGFVFLWSPPWTLLDAALNALVHGLVLVVVALLAAHVARLHRALLPRVPTLEGLVPICAFCNRIRDEHQEWKPLEVYITARSAATFSHGVCPACMTQYYGARFADPRNADRGRSSDPPPRISAHR
jgi:hypothetical protein